MRRKQVLLVLFALAFVAFGSAARPKKITFRVLETTDVHGNYFPRDFINCTAGNGSMARIYTYVKQQRQQHGRSHVLLFDAGDILQGQPSAYFYNYVDTVTTHACAAVLNYMGYDAATIGNHDVEAGHAVYDRWSLQCKMPMLGANIVRKTDGSTYWKPYTIVKKDGIRFAVLGMLTTGIPNWLPENLWSGMDFEDMVETARKYMPEMKAQSDVVIGLFHSGVGSEKATGTKNENASLQVAREVPGFDLILCGHDHRRACRKMVCRNGDSVQILNTGANAEYVAAATIVVTKQKNKVTVEQVDGELVNICDLEPDADFVAHFDKHVNDVDGYVQEKIGDCSTELDTRAAFFGPSEFVDFIHQLQLKISGADISFAAPLSFDAKIPAGEIRVSDMFNLYKFENFLYVMRLTGKEIKDFLEYSYNGWTQQMTKPEDHLLLFNRRTIDSPDPWQRLRTPSYNFDSAAGIIYTVDVREPKGHKVKIISLANGEPFDMQKTYRVAVNSYRGNGGGRLLTHGARIDKDELKNRIEWSTDKDLRFYLMQEIRQLKQLSPKKLNQWKFIPEEWTVPAAQRDSVILFK